MENWTEKQTQLLGDTKWPGRDTHSQENTKGGSQVWNKRPGGWRLGGGTMRVAWGQKVCGTE